MNAIVVRTEADERPLSWREVPDPRPEPREVMVRVAATAVNRADLMQRAGQYPPPPGAPEYLGLELAGTVVATGVEVQDWQAGDRVCALVAGGGYAELAAVPEPCLIPVPAAMSLQTAAAIPEAFLTAYVNLFLEAGLQAGERVLIHGGASGVGTSAIQLAKSAGAWVAVTGRNQKKLQACRELGADLAINHTSQDFREELAPDRLVDIVLDMVGAEYLQQNVAVLRERGRLVIISLLSGADARLDLRPVLTRRLRIVGSVLRSRSVPEKGQIVSAFVRRFLAELAGGAIAPVIESIRDIREVEQAHAEMRRYQNIGKLVLTVPQGA